MLKSAICAAFIGLAIVGTMSLPASAFKKVDLPGTRSKEYMKDLCTGSGRQYVEGQGQYGCISNCGDSQRESDACGINCSEETNKCYGWTPARRSASNKLQDILRPNLAPLKTMPPANSTR
jgi:hypothetical protein